MTKAASVEQGDSVRDSHVGKDKVHGDKYVTTTQVNGVLGEILGRVMDLQKQVITLENNSNDIKEKITGHCKSAEMLEVRVAGNERKGNKHDVYFLSFLALYFVQICVTVWILYTLINHIGG